MAGVLFLAAHQWSWKALAGTSQAQLHRPLNAAAARPVSYFAGADFK
jgi:hypothetical protein